MKQVDIDRGIATEAALMIVNTLVERYNLSIDKIFRFLECREGYKDILDNDDVLICMLHDNSIDDFITFLGEKINE